MKKIFGILIILILMVIGISLVIYGIINEKTPKIENKPSTTGKAIIANSITKENLDLFLEKQDFIKNLPDNSIIALRIYNIENNEQKIEADYTITKGSVEKKSPENYEVEMLIHSKYLPELGSNLCDTMKKAKTNGDLKINTFLSAGDLIWKYKGMLKYRNCIGV